MSINDQVNFLITDVLFDVHQAAEFGIKNCFRALQVGFYIEVNISTTLIIINSGAKEPDIRFGTKVVLKHVANMVRLFVYDSQWY